MARTELAIRGGRPAVTRPAPRWPVADELDISRMEAVIRGGQWSWMGPHERAFCKEFAAFLGTKHCLVLANGTVTLECALQAVGVRPGDEVIVPGLTWTATAQAAMDIGANVVFADIDEETYCLDPKAAEGAVTARTRAMIPVHLYGCMCDMDALMDLAGRRGLKVVEDVAHQHGSRWRNRAAGAIGQAGSFSFQQSKVLTSGEGGAIVCSDDDVYTAAFCLKHAGWMPDLATPGKRYGRNFRATEMQAVLLRGGLGRLPEQVRIREENAAVLREGFERIGGAVRASRPDPRVTCQSYYGMSLHFDAARAGGLTREQYLAVLAVEGFALSRPYPPTYRHDLLNFYDSTSPIPFRDAKAVQDYAGLKLPVTERVCGQEGLVLMHWFLLGERAYTNELLEAMAKVNDNLPSARAHFEQVTVEKG